MSTTISILFEKDKDGKLTNDALLYHDLLRYEREYPNQGFRFTEIANWLIKNNKEFRDYYTNSNAHTPMSYRVGHRRRRIQGCIDNLISLKLMYVKASVLAEKNRVNIPLYAFSAFGQLIAWLIEDSDPAKKETANEEIYRLIVSSFQNHSAPAAIFSSLFFKKCKDNNVFGDYVDRLREVLYSKQNLTSQREFLTQLKFVPYRNIENGKRTMHLWNEALNELEPSVKQQYMHSLKVEIEKNMEAVVKNHSDFERVRFELRSDHEIVALEAFCTNCKRYRSVGVKLGEYMGIMELHTNEHVPASCPQCNMHSLTVPFV